MTQHQLIYDEWQRFIDWFRHSYLLTLKDKNVATTISRRLADLSFQVIELERPTARVLFGNKIFLDPRLASDLIFLRIAFVHEFSHYLLNHNGVKSRFASVFAQLKEYKAQTKIVRCLEREADVLAYYLLGLYDPSNLDDYWTRLRMFRITNCGKQNSHACIYEIRNSSKN